MMLTVMLALAYASLQPAERAAMLLADAVATVIAANYSWRLSRISRELLAARGRNAAETHSAARHHRRLMAKHLRLSLAMTAHSSLFSQSSARGYALAQQWAGRV